MSDDAKEWVTVKVPREDKEKADEYRPDGATFGDCLRAGAERLNDTLNSDDSTHLSDITTEPTGESYTRDTDWLDGSDVEEALADAGVSLTYDDVKAACGAALRDELADEVLGR